MQRPYPILPPPPQKKPICVIPFPGSGKKAVQTFNPREYWAWGANLNKNCAAFSTYSIQYHVPSEPLPCTFGWSQRETQRAWSALASSANGNILYAGDGSAGPGSIYKSINSGVSWTSTSAPSREWSSIATSTDGVTVVAVNSPQGTTDGDIYYSLNSGVTWVLASAPTNQDWTSVASSSDGVKLVACNRLGGGGGSVGNIYTSGDSGGTWVLTSAPTSSAWSCVASSSDGVKLVACTGTGSIYTSTDSGLNWNFLISSFGVLESVASSSSGAILYACDTNGVWKSTDSGVTWSHSLPIVGSSFTSIATSTDGVKVIAVNFGEGVYRSTNSGASWVMQYSIPFTADWQEATSSADGEKLAVAGFTTFIYTFACT